MGTGRRPRRRSRAAASSRSQQNHAAATSEAPRARSSSAAPASSACSFGSFGRASQRPIGAEGGGARVLSRCSCRLLPKSTRKDHGLLRCRCRHQSSDGSFEFAPVSWWFTIDARPTSSAASGRARAMPVIKRTSWLIPPRSVTPREGVRPPRTLASNPVRVGSV